MRTWLLTLFHGAVFGLALNSLVCLGASYGLHLGYYAPCFTWLTERFGGELNAALAQMAAFALLSAAAALGCAGIRHLHNHHHSVQA